MIKYIIFDFDGTIADSMNIMLELGNELADKYGLNKITHDELIALNQLPIRERCKRIGVPMIKIPQYYIELVNKCRMKAGSLKPFEGIDKLLGQLSQTYNMIIITSNSLELVKTFLHHQHLECFSSIESSTALFSKDITIKKFLKKAKLDREEVLYIGDELRDIEACKRVGIKIISVSWGYDSHDLLLSGKPDYLVTKPEEIVDIFKKHL